MRGRYFSIMLVVFGICLAPGSDAFAADREKGDKGAMPAKVYVPYDKLKDVFEAEGQGVFLPYEDFQRLWRAAQGKPKDVSEAPFKYLISTSKFAGTVKDELAVMQMTLTIDILADGWVDVPIGLGEVGVSNTKFIEPKKNKTKPLLRVVDGQYVLTTKGKGRYVLAVDFVRQLETKPGLNILSYRIPSSAVTTLELLIPEENLKVDTESMLAATTSQVEKNGKKSTRLQAFLGAARQVRLSWKPKTQAAAELDPVMICEQFQHINISEALINYEIRLNYTIRRGGVDSFTVQLPGGFRVTDVSGANILKWDIEAGDTSAQQSRQVLKVKLFSAAKDNYSLTVKMEQFLQEAEAEFALVPVVTEQVLRRSGLIGITCSQRRLYNLVDVTNLARVDTGRLPGNLQNQPGVTAYRFIAPDYSAMLRIETASPRISVNQKWMLGVDSDRMDLRGRINYKVERTGIFELDMDFPEPWKIESIKPENVVDDYELKGEGVSRRLHILLRQERTGDFALELSAYADRSDAEEEVDFRLPLADSNDLQLYDGQLILLLAEHLRAEVKELRQLQGISVDQAPAWTSMEQLSTKIAFEFRAIDREKPSGVTFKIAVKPPQVSAVVHHLVNIERGFIIREAIIQYRVRYAPVDTFYVKMPEEFAEGSFEISGKNIKEKPRIDALPSDQVVVSDDSEADETKWAYFKIVLQSKVTGSYRLRVWARRTFQAGEVGQTTTVNVIPVLAAGKLSDQNGYIAIAKAETLAIGEPEMKNLTSADPGSSQDLPYRSHRKVATLAFKYNAPPFTLSFPVVIQKEAAVFTTIVTGAVVEQVLGRDGTLNTHAMYLLQTAKGDRLSITFPAGAQLTAILLNGQEVATEMGVSPDERIVHLGQSAGLVSRFVLEVSYGLTGASASKLIAPKLSERCGDCGFQRHTTYWVTAGISASWSLMRPRTCSESLVETSRVR